MDIQKFGTELFFEKHEFSKPYALSSSDCQTLSVAKLLEISSSHPEELLSLELGYTPMRGQEATRKAISSLYQNVSSQEVIVLGAPVEGIFLTHQVLLSPKNHAIALSPAYDALLHSTRHSGAQLIEWKLKLKDNQWQLSDLEPLIQEETKLLVLNFPHNPTGFLPKQEKLEQIIRIAEKYDLWIFSDEMYRGLEYQKEDRLPSMTDLYPKSIVLSGASKTLGLAGLRFGWLIVKDQDLAKEIINLKSYTSMCAPQINEFLGQKAIQSWEKIAQKNIKIIQKNLSLAQIFFEKWSEKFEWIPPQAGSVSVARINATSAHQYCENLAEKAGIVLLPSCFMGMSDQYVRFGLGRNDFETCLKQLDLHLESSL